MEHVYKILLKCFGFGKDWVNIPLPKFLPIRIRWACWHKPLPATWQIGICEAEPNLTTLVLLEDVGTIVYRRKRLFLWAGACPDCDRVYFAMATQLKKPDPFKVWQAKKQNS